jgi:hypothetical protein
VDLPQVSTLDLGSLERFQSELVDAGFEPRAGGLWLWEGPIAEPLRQFTSASTMKIAFLDGWPFQHPRLFVDGIDELHMNAHGELCLWHPGAASDQWLSFSGFLARIAEWAKRTTESDSRPEDFALDAHLAFGNVESRAIATVELDRLRLGESASRVATISGRWNDAGNLLEISAGSDGHIEGRGYWVTSVRTAPRDLIAAKALLTPYQQRNFDRRYAAVVERGEPRVFLFAWQRELGREALVVLAKKLEGEVVAQAIQVAPKDMAYLKLRAGPDAQLLSGKHVVVFGAGAIGSNVAFRLAEAGLGMLTLVDDDQLRPGDVVRHAADRHAIGWTKVEAIFVDLGSRTPWTKVNPIVERPWSPVRVGEIAQDADCVVDAVGLASFTNQLSILLGPKGTPLVSAALFRAGSVARVRRQALPADVSIAYRSSDGKYPSIPADATESFSFEPGCSAPVNNASPVAVAASAALTAGVTIDFLAGRAHWGDEVIEVYRALEEPPFDCVGTFRS